MERPCAWKKYTPQQIEELEYRGLEDRRNIKIYKILKESLGY